MKLKQESTAPDVRIDIVPLIDVIFCILTFFILAALGLTRQQAINVDLPTASTGVSQMRQMLIVSVDPIGQTYIDQQLVTRDRLQQTITDYQQKNPQGLMVLYASRNAAYSDVVGVLDLLRSVGGDRVALATLPDGGAQPTDPGTIPQGTGQNPSLNDPLANPGSGIPGTSTPSVPGATDPFNPNQDLFPGNQGLPAPSSPIAPSQSGGTPPAKIPTAP